MRGRGFPSTRSVRFLSPKVVPTLQSLGLWSGFMATGPAHITRVVLHFETRAKRLALPEPARPAGADRRHHGHKAANQDAALGQIVDYSLSRYALDDLLSARAGERLFGPERREQETVLVQTEMERRCSP
jgi:hypothetical protein